MSRREHGASADFVDVCLDRRFREPILIDAVLRWDNSLVCVQLTLEEARQLLAARLSAGEMGVGAGGNNDGRT
jgi:hypothetical protein